MRRSDHPSRPSAITCSRFSALKTLAIPAAGAKPPAHVNVSAPGAALAGFQVSINGRFWVSTEGQSIGAQATRQFPVLIGRRSDLVGANCGHHAPHLPGMRFGTPHPMPGHVIVTGATGFIGSHLSTRLLGEGCRLTIVTRHPDSPSARWLASRGARVVTADLTDADALLRAADDEPCDALIHLGASVNLAGDDMRATNVAGTAN